MNKFIIIFLLILSNVSFANENYSYITGVGSSHFEAHRMAYNAANSAGMRVRQQISTKSSDGLWHVIIKVSPK